MGPCDYIFDQTPDAHLSQRLLLGLAESEERRRPAVGRPTPRRGRSRTAPSSEPQRGLEVPPTAPIANRLQSRHRRLCLPYRLKGDSRTRTFLAL